MSLTAWLLILTLAVPLAMLIACSGAALRERMLVWLPLGALPGLMTALLATRDEAWVFGSARFPLAFAIDRPGGALLGVAALLWLAGGWYAATYQAQAPQAVRTRFAICWLMTLTGCLGLFVVGDMVLLYGLLALLSIGTTGLVMTEPTPRALRAGSIYLGMALLAESLLLAGFVLIVASAPGNTLLIAEAPAASTASPWRDVILGLLITGFGIKAGLVPLHFWIPLAHAAAPVPASAMLSGAVLKASVIGLIRFMPFEATPWIIGVTLAGLGLTGALYAVLVGITQRHPKAVLAYSSVSQMGVILGIIGMGMAAGDPATGLIAGFYAVNHVLSKGALFMAVGVVAETGRQRLWRVLVPAGLLAVGLGGLPLSGGALTKSVAKNLLGDGPGGVLATLSAIGTTVLMLHFVRRLKAFAADDAQSQAAPGLRWPWLLMATASLVVPWVLYLMSPSYSLPDALSPYALWSAIWPIMVGMVLAWALVSWKEGLPQLPEGDVVVGLATVWRAVTERLSAVAARLNATLLHWPAAGLMLVALLTVFAVLIRG